MTFINGEVYSLLHKAEACVWAVQKWYEGGAKYDFGKPGFSFDTADFTQARSVEGERGGEREREERENEG